MFFPRNQPVFLQNLLFFQQIFILVIPISTVVSKGLVASTHMLQRVSGQLSHSIHHRIMLTFLSQLVVRLLQIGYHGDCGVYIWTRVGRHAWALRFVFESQLFSLLTLGRFALAFVFVFVVQFFNHAFSPGCVTTIWMCVVQIDHACFK